MARLFMRLELSAVQAAEWMLDLIFPPACGNCGRVDYRFCPGCRHKLEQAAIQISPGTREARVDLAGLIATGRHHGVLQNAVQAFKYNGARDLAAPLASRLVEALQSVDWQVDAAVPVPLFAEREAERGYNQSMLLCRYVVVATGIMLYADSLKRVRNTYQQALLSQADRRENVRDAFEASDDVRGLSLLVVDDVVTTGSTLGECAKALKAKGADAIYGIAVSHG